MDHQPVGGSESSRVAGRAGTSIGGWGTGGQLPTPDCPWISIFCIENQKTRGGGQLAATSTLMFTSGLSRNDSPAGDTGSGHWSYIV